MLRLPVIQQSAVEDERAAARPPWHWCFVGAGLLVTIWVPLAVVSAPLGAALAARCLHVVPADVARGAVVLPPRQEAWLAALSALPLIVCFGLAAVLAGALVGRFGGRAGRREAGIAGLIAAFAVTSLAALGGAGLSAAAVVAAFLALAAVGAPSGYAGAGIGVRKRSVLGSPR